MAEVIPFRPFRIPTDKAAQAFGVKNSNPGGQEFMIADLAASGLIPSDLYAFADGAIWRPPGAECGYEIPYFYPDGQPIVDENQFPAMFRIRYKPKPGMKCERYMQPSLKDLERLGFSGTIPYLPPYRRERDTIAICEGEKKTIAVLKHLGMDAIGIGGHTMWNHEWLFEACRGKHVVIIPDADILRYDINRSYGAMSESLSKVAKTVEIVKMDKKIDDWIMEGGNRDMFDHLERMETVELVLTGEALINKFHLAFHVQGRECRKVPYQTTSNVMRIMESSEAFLPIWENSDTGRVFFGEDEIEPGKTEVDIAHHFQHQFGMEKITHRHIQVVMGALAIQNARSLFLQWIREQVWDGVPRLDTWLSRLWGAEDTPRNREIASKWVMGSCARLCEPGCKIDWMLIIVGPQSTGKTSMPSVLFQGLNSVLYGHDEGKDAKMALHSALCVGFDELDGISRREQSTLKAMITCAVDVFRKPYQAAVGTYPRRCVLYGCGNKRMFLQEDDSGYRRYGIVEIDRLFDFQGLKDELGQLWAEAWKRYCAGEEYWDIKIPDENIEQYVVQSSFSELVDAGLTLLEQQGKKSFQSNVLYNAMGLDGGRVTNAQAKEIANLLRTRGWSQKKVKIGGVSVRAWSQGVVG